MTNTNEAAPFAAADGRREVQLLDVLAMVLQQWKLVAAFTVGAVVLATAAVLLRPAVYVANTVLVPFPSATGSRLSSLGAALPGGLPRAVYSAAGGPRDNTVESVLQSQALRDTVAARVAARDPGRRTMIRRIVQKNTRFTSDVPSGRVAVQVRAPDAALAAAIANAVPEAINDIVTDMRVEGGQYRSRYMEQELGDAREQLVLSEQRLLEFQNRAGAADLPEQAKQTVEAAVQMQRAIVEQEVEVARLRRTLAPGHPQLRAAEAELGTRRAQLRRLTQGRAGNPVFVPIEGAGEMRTAAARIMREFAANEQIYLSLAAAVADSRIETNNRVPPLAVLDRAPVPDSPDSGHRSIIILASALVGLWLGLLVGFLREHLRRSRGTSAGETFDEAWGRFKSDVTGSIPGLRRRNGVGAGK